MEKQVLSIEQMQELINLGIDVSKAHLWWYYDERTIPIVVSIKCNFSNSTYIPTFTLQDVLEMLPKPCYINCIDEDFYQCEVTTDCGSLSSNGGTALVAAFNMLRCINN